jgi:hypothetical protein
MKQSHGVEFSTCGMYQIVPKTRAKCSGGVVQVVECLLCKCKTMSSNPSPKEKDRQRKGGREGAHGGTHL